MLYFWLDWFNDSFFEKLAFSSKIIKIFTFKWWTVSKVYHRQCWNRQDLVLRFLEDWNIRCRSKQYNLLLLMDKYLYYFQNILLFFRILCKNRMFHTVLQENNNIILGMDPKFSNLMFVCVFEEQKCILDRKSVV